MREHLYSLVLVALLGSSFAGAQGMPGSMPPRQYPQGMPPEAPTPSQSSTDQAALRTQADIQSALAKDDSLAGDKIKVHVTNSAVELKGTVPTQDAKDRLEQIATAHSGGLPVKNKVKVAASSPK